MPGSARLGGQRGFCFGVSPETWEVPSPEAVSRLVASGDANTKKRGAFLSSFEWRTLHNLMVDAGLLDIGSLGAATINVDRCAHQWGPSTEMVTNPVTNPAVHRLTKLAMS